MTCKDEVKTAKFKQLQAKSWKFIKLFGQHGTEEMKKTLNKPDTETKFKKNMTRLYLKRCKTTKGGTRKRR